MPGEGVHVRLSPWAVVGEALPAVLCEHEATELDSHEDAFTVVGVGRDPPDVGGPRPGREAPARPRGDLLEGCQLLEGVAAVATAEETARLRPDVEGTVGGRNGDREDIALGKLARLLPGLSPVGAADDAAGVAADVDRVGVAGVNREARGAGSLERPLDVCARLRLHAAEAVAGGEENSGHDAHGTSAGSAPALGGPGRPRPALASRPACDASAHASTEPVFPTVFLAEAAVPPVGSCLVG